MSLESLGFRKCWSEETTVSDEPKAVEKSMPCHGVSPVVKTQH